MVKGLAQGDAGMVASVYAADARLLPPGMDVQTGQDIQRCWQAPVDAELRYAHIDTVSYGVAEREARAAATFGSTTGEAT